jgi:hypothetical protein
MGEKCGGGTVFFAIITWLILMIIVILYGNGLIKFLWFILPGCFSIAPLVGIIQLYCNIKT